MESSTLCSYDTTEPVPREDVSTLERARLGDSSARNALLTSLLGKVEILARQSWMAYRWSRPSLDWQDLVQDAYEQMIRYLDQALSEFDPIGYLIGIARLQIRSICYHEIYDSSERPIPIPQSMDALLPGCEETTLYDVTPWTPPISPYAAETASHQDLYQAIEQLPDAQQTVIVRHYGIGENPREEAGQIAKAMRWTTSETWSHRIKALGALYFALEKVYPTYAQGTMELVEYKRNPATTTRSLSDQQRERLDRAYTAIVNRGEKVTTNRLRQEAHMSPVPVLLYLREHRPQISRQQRLDDACARLEARGEKITGDALMREARVSRKIIVLYLRHKQYTQERSQRFPIDPTNGKSATMVTIGDILQQDFVASTR